MTANKFDSLIINGDAGRACSSRDIFDSFVESQGQFEKLPAKLRKDSATVKLSLFREVHANKVNNHEVAIEKILTASPSDQPQIVVNEELRNEITTLSSQLEDVSFDFRELKGNQTSLQRNVDEDFDEVDEKLDEMNKTLAKLLGHLGL